MEVTIDKDAIRQYLENTLDRRFSSLISSRQQWNDNSANKIISIAQGSAPSPHKSILVKLYTNLNDPTLPTLFRKALAKETAWIDKDFFRWAPDGIESTDIEGTYWITDWQKDNLNNELSNFHDAIRAVIHQLKEINLGAWAYNWVVKPKMQRIRQSEKINGQIIVKDSYNQQIPQEYDIQGLQFHFINALNIYPDVISETTFETTRKLDLYYKCYRSIMEIKADPKYNPQEPYTFEQNVIYRGLDCLDEVQKDLGIAYDTHEIKLNKYLNQDSNQSQDQRNKSLLEIRYAILKEVRIQGKYLDGDGHGYRIEYIKQGANCYPLFIEKNEFPFEQKNIRVARAWANPNIFYNDSEFGMMTNQHNFLIYNKQMQASALVKATNPTQILSTQLLRAFENSKDVVAKLLTQPGGIEYADFSVLMDNSGIDHSKPLTLGTVEENMRNLELFQQAIDRCKADIAQSNVQVTDSMGANATAAYNNQVAAEQDSLSKEFKGMIIRELIQPACEYALEMAKFAFEEQKLVTNITPEDKKYLEKTLAKARKEVKIEEGDEIEDDEDEIPYEDIKALAAEKNVTLPKLAQMGGEESLITYNPITDKKQAIISRALFQNTKCAFKFEVEDTDYSKRQLLEEIVQIYGNILANIPDSPLKYLVAKLSIVKTLQASSDSNLAEISEEAEKLYQQMITPPQPSPEEQALAQSKIQAEQASAQQKQATAQKQTAEAAKIGQEVQANNAAMQMVGV